jgi:uncharacterized protein (TIGR02271 family)
MLNESEAQELMGKTVYSGEGEKIGKAGQVFLDDRTGRPEFLTVNTGLFGTSESFVPLQGASFNGEDVTVPYSKAQIKDAPRIDLDGDHLDQADEDRLFAHYDQGAGTHTHTGDSNTRGDGGDGDVRGVAGESSGQGHDTSGPNTDEAMTRSEEQLHVGTQSVEAGRARLRKYVVTENVSRTVPVSHEEIRVEREPITDATIGDALDGPAISEEEHEVTLRAERPVVEKEAVPVERVRLDTQTVTEQQQVTDTVRKEQIEADTDLRP